MIADRATRDALAGGLRLVLGDRAGLAAMDTGLDGFWSSFRAMAILAPAVLLLVALDPGADPRAAETAPGTLVAVVSAGLTYVLGWIAFPALLAVVARPLGLGRVFVPWMVARNWTAVPASLPYVTVVALWGFGLLPQRALGGATLAALGFSLFCGWRVARLAGGQPAMAAVGFTLLDFLLGLLIELSIDRLFGT